MATGRLPDANTAPLTAKGDLYTYSTANARLAVGSNGDTLVADSAASTGLRWQGNYSAGKNKIINGDFGVWQRGTSFSTSGAWSFNADRFQGYMSSGTATLSQQTFTPGTAPVAGYEGTYFLRATAPASGGTFHFRQSIEDVRTFAGQTVTLSFWAKASATTSLNTYFNQSFGSGGSATVNTTAQTNTITTSWARYTYTVTLGSISGKTIGTGSFIEPYFVTVNNFTSSATIDLWGIQVEAGSVATAFQTATGTIQGELAACQRYYYRLTATGDAYMDLTSLGSASATTQVRVQVKLPVTMRVIPTSIDFSNLGVNDGVTLTALTGLTFSQASPDYASLATSGATGLTQYRPYWIRANNNTAAYLGFSAEL